MHKLGQLRIIAGTHRGRMMEFPSEEGLRPTPNRVRETLFNWLQDELYDIECVDLFAGSGALGFEALSRGAKKVIFVEKESSICRALSANAVRFGWSQTAVIVQGLAESWIDKNMPVQGYFLDPSFVASHPNRWLEQLERAGHLQKAQWVYCERPVNSEPLKIPEGWTCYREKQAASVSYALLKPNRQAE